MVDEHGEERHDGLHLRLVSLLGTIPGSEYDFSLGLSFQQLAAEGGTGCVGYGLLLAGALYQRLDESHSDRGCGLKDAPPNTPAIDTSLL